MPCSIATSAPVAGELGRLRDAPGPVERLAEVDVGPRDLLDVAALLGDAQGLLAVFDPRRPSAPGVARARRTSWLRMLPSSRRAPAARAISSAGSQTASASIPRPSSMSRCPSEREDARTARRVAVVRQQRDGGAAALEALERVAADPEVASEALGDQRGRHGVGVGVDQRQRPARQGRGAVVLAGEVRRLRGAADEVDEARPRGAHVLGHAVPQLDRALVVGVGLGEGGQPRWPRRRPAPRRRTRPAGCGPRTSGRRARR